MTERLEPVIHLTIEGKGYDGDEWNAGTVSEELGSGVCWRGFGAKCVDKLIREEQGR